MPEAHVTPIARLLPPAAGVELRIDFNHLEAQTIKNAPGLEVILGVMGGLELGPLVGSLIAGAVLAAKGEIGEKDKGEGVVFIYREIAVPFPEVSVSIETRGGPQSPHKTGEKSEFGGRL